MRDQVELGGFNGVLAQWRRNPAKMVKDLFDAEPAPWQRRHLENFPAESITAVHACPGAGKTTVLAWLVWNFLLTRPVPKVIVLSDGSLREQLAFWHQIMPASFREQFSVTDSWIALKESPETWYATLREAEEPVVTVFAGVSDSHVLYVADDADEFPPEIWLPIQGTANWESHVLRSGRP